MDISWAINIWQVISGVQGKEEISFYKTVLINTKPIAIQIKQEEFEQLTKHLRPKMILHPQDIDMLMAESF